MKARLQAVLAHVDSMTVRERIVGFIAALAITYAAWTTVLFGPLEQRRGELSAAFEQLNQEVHSLNAQAGAVAMLRSADPDDANRVRLQELRTETAKLKLAIDKVAARLVPPKEMANVLEAMLTRETGLELIKFQGLGAQSVLANSVASDEPIERNGAESHEKGESSALIPPVALGLFKHGLKMEFQGEYLAALNYLLALESLSWDFIWESVDLQIVQHPLAKISITVFSLSLDEAWIGV